MTPQELIAYYQTLLIIQYALKTKARGTIAAFVTEFVASMIIQQVRASFAIPTAVGVQLDVLGTYRGAQRVAYGLDVTKTYFSMMPATASPAAHKGFSMAATFPDTSWYWLTVADFSAAKLILSDAEMRQLIQYLAQVQSVFYGLAEIDDILNEFFGENLKVIDNEDMTLTYTHQLADPNLLFKVVNYLDALPRPAGVGISVVEV